MVTLFMEYPRGPVSSLLAPSFSFPKVQLGHILSRR